MIRYRENDFSDVRSRRALVEIWEIVHTPTKLTRYRTAEDHFQADFDSIRKIVRNARLPVVTVDKATKKVTVHRHLLPASGPIVVCDTNGLPWTDTEWRRKWRKVATAAGVPNDTWNMDSRSGAITEAIAAGMPIEMVRHAATHSDVSQTAAYDRGQEKATAKVMQARIDSRKNKETT